MGYRNNPVYWGDKSGPTTWFYCCGRGLHYLRFNKKYRKKLTKSTQFS